MTKQVVDKQENNETERGIRVESTEIKFSSLVANSGWEGKVTSKCMSLGPWQNVEEPRSVSGVSQRLRADSVYRREDSRNRLRSLTPYN